MRGGWGRAGDDEFVDELHGGRRRLVEDGDDLGASGNDSLREMTKTTAVSTEDTVAQLVSGRGHARARRCSPAGARAARNGEEERWRARQRRGNGRAARPASTWSC